MDPLSGHLFVFCNGRRNRLKVLYWDGSGLWICSKRLEKGRFSWPVQGDEQDFGELSRAGRVRMSSEELTLLVSGIELSQSRRKDSPLDLNSRTNSAICSRLRRFLRALFLDTFILLHPQFLSNPPPSR